MRIAFVGKGGSGKTTISTLFTLFLENKNQNNIYFIDADLNKNAASQFGINTSELLKLGTPSAQVDIRNWLLGKRQDIPKNNLKYFKKTTPPRLGSNIIKIDQIPLNLSINKYFVGDKIKIAEVGEYDKELIAKNCYHGSLSILENFLSHLDDRSGWLIADMVAGTDAFVGALFAQFDLIFIVAEPTRNSREVVRQFEQLAVETQTQDIFKIIGNKIEGNEDIEFIKSFSTHLEYLTSLSRSKYLKKAEMIESRLEITELEEENLSKFEFLLNKILVKVIDPEARLSILKKWHHKVAMDHIGVDREVLLRQISDEVVFN